MSLVVKNRLSLIISPAELKPIPLASKNASGRMRMIDLHTLLHLPMDVFYEVIACITPLDLLHLSRASKDFRAFFLSRSSSLSIWKRVLGQTPFLPPCPIDLTEPQFASLMYENSCMACGSSQGTIETDYKTRLRFCRTCRKKNIIHGFYPKSRYPALSDDVFTMLPFFGVHLFWTEGEDLISTINDKHMSYFRPKFNIMMAEVEKFEDKTSASYFAFVVQQQTNASRMITEGRALALYQQEVEQTKEDGLELLTNTRCAYIKERMRALGWDERFFPFSRDDDDFKNWDKYLYAPAEFSINSWNRNRSSLTDIYNRTKERRQTESLTVRAVRSYRTFRASLPVDERRRLPMLGDFLQPNYLQVFLVTHHKQCSEETITELMHMVVEKSQDDLSRVEVDLARRITDCLHSSDQNNSLELHDSSAHIDVQRILHRASTMFLCNCPACVPGPRGQRRVFSYPNVLDHVQELQFMDLRWREAVPDTNIDVIETSRNVLAALNLSEECDLTDVDALGKFRCLCDHHLYQGELTFDRLVEHVYHQQMIYKLLRVQASINPDERLLLNGHAQEQLSSLVRVVTEAHGDISNETNHFTDFANDQYCRYCYQLVQGCWEYDETMSHHLKYIHGQDPSDGAFEDLNVLKIMYGLRMDDVDLSE